MLVDRELLQDMGFRKLEEEVKNQTYVNTGGWKSETWASDDYDFWVHFGDEEEKLGIDLQHCSDHFFVHKGTRKEFFADFLEAFKESVKQTAVISFYD